MTSCGGVLTSASKEGIFFHSHSYLSYFYTDIDECLEAVANQRDICPANTACVNTIGSFQCVCVPGYELVDGTCQRKF